MRRASVIIRCDGAGCKEVAEVENLGETPPGWYQIKQADESFKLPTQGWDFHELRCVEKWARLALAPNNGTNGHRGEDRRDEVLTAIELFEGHPFASSDLQEATGLVPVCRSPPTEPRAGGGALDRPQPRSSSPLPGESGGGQ